MKNERTMQDKAATANRLARINQTVAKHYGIGVREIKDPARPAEIVWPRQVAMMLAVTDGIIPRLVAEYYGKSRPTVLHAVRMVRSHAELYPTVAETLVELAEKMKEAA